MNCSKTCSHGLYFSADHFSARTDFCKLTSENLRGTTRIQLLVVRIVKHAIRVYLCSFVVPGLETSLQLANT